MVFNNKKVEFISYEQIGEKAYETLRKYNYESTIPVPIEKIIEFNLKINIVPFNNLFKTYGINALISSDLKTIYVDEYLFTNINRSYRFTLAHELGHLILHKDYFSQINIKNLTDWKKFIISVDEKKYQRLEIQANHFAGQILVPQNPLINYFNIKLKNLFRKLSKEEIKSFKRDDYIDLIKNIISEKLAAIFEVSDKVIKIRIEKSSLVSKIP